MNERPCTCGGHGHPPFRTVMGRLVCSYCGYDTPMHPDSFMGTPTPPAWSVQVVSPKVEEALSRRITRIEKALRAMGHPLKGF